MRPKLPPELQEEDRQTYIRNREEIVRKAFEPARAHPMQAAERELDRLAAEAGNGAAVHGEAVTLAHGIEIADGPAREGDGCTWPGCDRPGLCQSGNFGGQIVCSEHFTRTNGETGKEAADRIKRELGEVIERIRAEGQIGTARHLRAALERLCP